MSVDTSKMHYTVKDVNELVDYFFTLASDQRKTQFMRRTQRDKLSAEVRANAYEDAARIIRQTLVDSQA